MPAPLQGCASANTPNFHPSNVLQARASAQAAQHHIFHLFLPKIMNQQLKHQGRQQANTRFLHLPLWARPSLWPVLGMLQAGTPQQDVLVPSQNAASPSWDCSAAATAAANTEKERRVQGELGTSLFPPLISLLAA